MPADRLNQITPFRVMELMKRAEELEARGHKVVHFEVGEPDFNTAEPIIEAGRQALIDGRTKYTHALGLLELREAIARDYATRLGVIVPVEQIAVTAGGERWTSAIECVAAQPGRRALDYRSWLPLQRGVRTPHRGYSPAGTGACGRWLRTRRRCA